MIKEDNFGDRSKFYLTLLEVDSLYSENCKVGQKAGSFYRIENKEQRRDKEKNIWLTGAT